ncbi:unnamed protein product [Urochloa humidicola]
MREPAPDGDAVQRRQGLRVVATPDGAGGGRSLRKSGGGGVRGRMKAADVAGQTRGKVLRRADSELAMHAHVRRPVKARTVRRCEVIRAARECADGLNCIWRPSTHLRTYGLILQTHYTALGQNALRRYHPVPQHLPIPPPPPPPWTRRSRHPPSPSKAPRVHPRRPPRASTSASTSEPPRVHPRRPIRASTSEHPRRVDGRVHERAPGVDPARPRRSPRHPPRASSETGIAVAVKHGRSVAVEACPCCGPVIATLQARALGRG